MSLPCSSGQEMTCLLINKLIKHSSPFPSLPSLARLGPLNAFKRPIRGSKSDHASTCIDFREQGPSLANLDWRAQNSLAASVSCRVAWHSTVAINARDLAVDNDDDDDWRRGIDVLATTLIVFVSFLLSVPPKYAKLSVRQASNSYNKGFLVENDLINLECCTNGDANPQPSFEWIKMPRTRGGAGSNYSGRAKLKSGFDTINPFLLTAENRRPNYLSSSGRICNSFELNMTRQDNNYLYKCMVSNEALANKLTIEDNLMLSVECKFDPSFILEPVKGTKFSFCDFVCNCRQARSQSAPERCSSHSEQVESDREQHCATLLQCHSFAKRHELRVVC